MHLQEQMSKHACAGVDEVRDALSARLLALQGPSTSLGKRKRSPMPRRDTVWSTFENKMSFFMPLPPKPETNLSDQEWTDAFFKLLDDVSDG